MPDWNSLPRLLQELCDGHPEICTEVYAFDEDGRRSWLCKSCWIRWKNPPIRVDLAAVARARKRAALERTDDHA